MKNFTEISEKDVDDYLEREVAMRNEKGFKLPVQDTQVNDDDDTSMTKYHDMDIELHIIYYKDIDRILKDTKMQLTSRSS